MKLSVIIVSYKVPYFLEQTLLSVRKAAQYLPTEVIVVDNNSRDSTVDLVREKFPEVLLIANTQNTGFATANNQGIQQSTGRYVLFLNPDTVVREDTFVKIVDFMEQHPKAGGLGVHMVDGTGRFLPESKRGFPSPMVAFYKTFGLSKLFPKSKRFNHYHLGYLKEDEIHEVDVLSGAFMLMPRAVLEEIGYWDEAFFMYGEDIDLSYRIVQAGYKNYYYPATSIIHYKGESTKKGTLNYVKTFYEAMIIFAKKHFQGSKASLFVFMLQMAIYFRAFLTLFSNLMRQGSLWVLDVLVMLGGLYLIKDGWAQIRFEDATYYHNNHMLVYFNFPFYVLCWTLAIYLRGGYDQRARMSNVLTGIILGTVAITSIYALFPQDLRSSRMLILLGALWTIVVTSFNRSLRSLIEYQTPFWSQSQQRNIIVVGSAGETQRVLNLLHRAAVDLNFLGRVSTVATANLTEVLGTVNDLEKLTAIYRANELIFCSKDIAYSEIMHWMQVLGPQVTYKIISENSQYIIGSNSKNTAGDLYALDINYKLANSIQLRNKRILDYLYSLLLLLLSPIICFLVKQPLGLFKNIIAVFRQQKTWVAYAPHPANVSLPPLPTGVLSSTDAVGAIALDPITIQRLNLLYAKDYSSASDWWIIWRAWRKLGQTNSTTTSKSKNPSQS